MITPRFSITQTPNDLTITIRAPYSNLKELEIYVENADFRFVCAPYYLRLTLPGSIVDNDASRGDFNQESGEFTLKYEKQTPGEHFENLHFITSLLTSNKSRKKVEKIEVVETDGGDEWNIDQNAPETGVPFGGYKYGFANQKSELNFEEFYTVFDVRDAQSSKDRKCLKTDTESMDFNVDHFIADYFDDAAINKIIEQQFPVAPEKFTDEELDFLKDLPNREYLLSTREIQNVLLGLMDILFAYLYDKRTTDFEGNCESGWTVTKLSSTLCWFDVFENAREMLTASFRRSLIYPLFRNFRLSTKIHQDLILLLNSGCVQIIKCLIDIYHVFNGSADPRYVLNDLYIKDYIIFMQKCPKQQLTDVIKNISEVKITEKDVNLNLRKLIQDQLKEINPGNSILEKMAKLNITRIESDSDSEDSDSDSEDSDSDSEQDTSESNQSSSDSDDERT